MKALLPFISFLLLAGSSFSQIINDHKVNFQYIQLPHFKIDDAFTNYTVNVLHGYQQANQDSLEQFELEKKYALEFFHESMERYENMVDSIDRIYLNQMAQWEKDVNAGKTQANGQPLLQPKRMDDPYTPVYPTFEEPVLHSQLNEEVAKDLVSISGFEKGFGGFVVTVNVLPITIYNTTERKKGSGSATKYEYTCYYSLPIELTVETPTQGKLIHTRIHEGKKAYKIGEYRSKYEYQAYRKFNKVQFRQLLEGKARTAAMEEVVSYLNNEIGFVNRTRYTEMYSVKRFKNYDYSDVTNAHTLTMQALNLVKNDPDRSGAISKINEAISAWNGVLEESNNYDNKARVNDKVTAMVHSNLAELELWKANFSEVDRYVNLINNEGGKFKRHISAQTGFYNDQKRRWNANF